MFGRGVFAKVKQLMEKIRRHPVVTVIIFWSLLIFCDKAIASPLVDMIEAPDIALEVIFKGLELLAAIGLNLWLTKQPLHWQAAIGKNSLIAFGIMGAIVLFATLAELGNFVDAATIAVIAAVPEEFAFRGVILGSLITHLKIESVSRRVGAAIVLSSALFSLAHLGNIGSQGLTVTLMQVIEVFGLGCVLGALYVRKGSLLFPMLAHGFLDYMVTIMHGYAATVGSAGALNATLFSAVLHMLMYIGLAIIICKPDSIHQLQQQVGALGERRE
jgi:membrane protease YdiL (CAAX protease family)